MLFRQLYKMFSWKVLHNKIFMALFVVFMCVAVFLPLYVFPILISPDTAPGFAQLNGNSLLYLVLPIAILVIYLVFATYVVFGISKQNNVDLYNNIRPIKRWKIALAKELSIFTIGMAINVLANLAIFIVIFMKIHNLPLIDEVSFSLVSLVTSSVAMAIFGALFVAISSYFKPLTSLIVNLLVFVLSIGGLVGPRFIPTSGLQALTYNANDQKRNYLKLYEFDNSGVIKNIKYAKEVEWDVTPETEKQKLDLNIYNPFNFMTSVGTMSWNAIVSPHLSSDEIVNISNAKAPNSIIEPMVSETPVLSGSYNLSKYFVASPIDEKTIFDFKDNESRYKAIAELLEKNSYLSSSLNDTGKWVLLNNKLVSSAVWLNIALSESEKQFLTYVAGLTDESKLIYDIIANHHLASKYLIGLDNYLKTRGFGDELINLLEFIWSDPISSSNLLGKSLDFVDIKNIYAIHPQITTLDEKGKAIDYDIDYIKKKEFKFDVATNGQVSVKVLNGDSTYVSLPNFDKVFPNIRTVSEYEKFIDANSTIVELKTLIDKAQQQLAGQQVKKYDFHNNVSDIYMLDKWIDLSVKKINFLQLSYLAMFLTLAIAINTHAFDRLGRKDLI